MSNRPEPYRSLPPPAWQATQSRDAAQRAYIENTVGVARSTADELIRLADLKNHGVITDAEFDHLKAKALS